MEEAVGMDDSIMVTVNLHKGQSVQKMTDEELQTLLDEISASNAAMQRETAMLDKYCERMVPKEEVQQLQVVTPEHTQAAQGRSRHRSRSRTATVERLLNLTAEQKCNIAYRELEETKEVLAKLRQDSNHTIRNLQATFEEAECALTEVKKAVYEFERDIATFSQGKKESTIVPETLFKYFEDKIHAKEMLIDKLQLKNHAWKMLKAKMHQQLRLKEEAGEMLREVDFHQLKIENTQFLRQIEQYNQDLLQLKIMTGQTQIVLNSYKDKVKAEELNKKFRNDISNYKVPDIIEYVQETWNRFNLEKKVKTWERKVDVAELSHKTCSKTWEKIKKVQ
ncbi:coiled-coil domain-containing protein 113 isoform X2 [Pristis pectinata]|uniref:coiled-coil domain-containing protein 113 isoform X2 n=1 Tax=Pristis pectinata TaxID=685728 RepID=UPI00223CE8C8|nr:coiled-coil domain-containing protein 113 isoform X2 [Pristis pectinata]